MDLFSVSLLHLQVPTSVSKTGTEDLTFKLGISPDYLRHYTVIRPFFLDLRNSFTMRVTFHCRNTQLPYHIVKIRK